MHQYIAQKKSRLKYVLNANYEVLKARLEKEIVKEKREDDK